MQFDADVFMQTAVTGASSTRVEQPDPGEYTAQVDKLDFDSFQGKKDPTKTYNKLSVTWEITDESVKATLGRDKVTVRQDMFLDLTESGSLDMGKGKNVSLGRLREAVGQNDPSRPWSPTMLQGAMARVKVEHEVVNGEAYARVTGVVKF